MSAATLCRKVCRDHLKPQGDRVAQIAGLRSARETQREIVMTTTVTKILNQRCTVFVYVSHTEFKFNADDRCGRKACYQLAARALDCGLEAVVENKATLTIYESEERVRALVASLSR